jgi:hypothetical protein
MRASADIGQYDPKPPTAGGQNQPVGVNCPVGCRQNAYTGVVVGWRIYGKRSAVFKDGSTVFHGKFQTQVKQIIGLERCSGSLAQKTVADIKSKGVPCRFAGETDTVEPVAAACTVFVFEKRGFTVVVCIEQ